ILRMRCAEHDCRRASEENSVTATDYSLIVKCIAEAKAWPKVVAIANRSGSVQADGREGRTRIVHCRFSEILDVVAQAQIQGELWINAPVILNKKSILIQIGMGLTSGSSGTGKILRERGRRVRGKQCIRVESELSAEKTREEVKDTIEIQVGAELQTVLAACIADYIDELPAFDSRVRW